MSSSLLVLADPDLGLEDKTGVQGPFLPIYSLSSGSRSLHPWPLHPFSLPTGFPPASCGTQAQTAIWHPSGGPADGQGFGAQQPLRSGPAY